MSRLKIHGSIPAPCRKISPEIGVLGIDIIPCSQPFSHKVNFLCSRRLGRERFLHGWIWLFFWGTSQPEILDVPIWGKPWIFP